MPHRANWKTALAAGVISGLALGTLFPSLGWDWLAWVALVPLFVAVADATDWRQALVGGLAAGVCFFALSCPWIAITIHLYGGLNAALAGFIFLLFLLLMGSYLGIFALFGYWSGRLLEHRLLPLPLLWVAVEWLRTYTPMGGFPWNLLGYSQSRHAGFMLTTTVAGIYGASLLIAVANALAASLWMRLRDAGRDQPARLRPAAAAWEGIGLGAVLAFATLPYHPPLPPPATLEARLVQPATPMADDWSAAELNSFLSRQQELSTWGPGHPDLILWPEQPAPLYYDRQPPLRETARAIGAQTGAALLMGEIYVPADGESPSDADPRNSAVLLDPSGRPLRRYDKLHLVPFGEYTPLPQWAKNMGGVGKLVQGVGDFVPGAGPVWFTFAGHRFATLICYESIFPALVRADVLGGAQWLVNLADDGWYGRSSAAAQGLEMARVRAIENRRWLLRDTNDGLTAVIDPYGRVTASLPRFAAGALEARFSPLQQTTFYTRHGDWLPALCAGMMGVWALAAAFLRRRRRTTS